MTARFFVQPADTTSLDLGTPTSAPLEFHRRLPGYARTPLVDRPELARSLGVGAVLVKVEANRLGLPAFKMLGASWAAYRAAVQLLGHDPATWTSVDELADRFTPLRPMALAAATDGNHGRAVARMARLLGFEARIFVPAGTVQARIDGVTSEGASCTVVEGSYDAAVARAAEEGSDHCLIISDTSWPGYEDVPRWVIEGYGTMFWEIQEELVARSWKAPDLVVVQMGVGALAGATVGHFRRPGAAADTRLLGVEPTASACVLASMEAGHLVTIGGPQDSIMAGLNCGTPSPIAWPNVSRGIDVYSAVDDAQAGWAMREFAEAGIVAGETGAAGLAGLHEVLHNPGAAAARSALHIDSSTRVLLLCTEGATDPIAYTAIVGRSPEAVAEHRELERIKP